VKRKRILIVACNNLAKGGIQAVIMNIVRNLHNKFQFDILCFDSKQSFYDEEFESYGGCIYRLPLYEGTNIFRKRADFYIRFSKVYHGVKKIVKGNKYDVIHCHNDIESGICLLAAKKQKIPVRIVHAHTSFDNFARYNIVRKMYSIYLKKLMFHNATDLVGCSKEANSILFAGQKSKVIYNTIDFSTFDKNKYGIKKKTDSPILLQVGLFSDNKNQIFSIDILKRIKEKYPNSKLVFVGRAVQGESEIYLDKIKEYISSEKLEQSIQFFSGDTDIPRVVAETDFFILPSKKEGLPLVLIEAQAMGKRCFVSDSVSNEIDCGGCIFLNLEKGASAWAEAIIKNYDHNNEMQLDFDMSKFNTETIMNQFEKIYSGDEI